MFIPATVEVVFAFSDDDNDALAHAVRHVAEQFTGTPGKYVKLEDTITSFRAIIDGELDKARADWFGSDAGIFDFLRDALPDIGASSAFLHERPQPLHGFRIGGITSQVKPSQTTNGQHRAVL